MEEFNIHITNLNQKTLQKMFFIYNALENGWNIKKKHEYYVFSKKHEGKKEILDEEYLSSFIKDNFEFKNIKITLSSENSEI